MLLSHSRLIYLNWPWMFLNNILGVLDCHWLIYLQFLCVPGCYTWHTWRYWLIYLNWPWLFLAGILGILEGSYLIFSNLPCMLLTALLGIRGCYCLMYLEYLNATGRYTCVEFERCWLIYSEYWAVTAWWNCFDLECYWPAYLEYLNVPGCYTWNDFACTDWYTWHICRLLVALLGVLGCYWLTFS